MEAPVRERYDALDHVRGLVSSFGESLLPKLHYHSALNILHLAHIEGETLHEIDDDIRTVCYRYGKSLLFIYGHTDRYTPLTYPPALKAAFPDCSLVFRVVVRCLRDRPRAHE